MAPKYGHPPPSYNDALNDLPPDYATITPFARQKDLIQSPAPERTTKESRTEPRSLPVDPACDVVIDWENPTGVREHKKKKPAKRATPQSTSNNADNDDNPDEGADEGQGDGGGDGGGSGDGNGDDGAGGGDDGDGWDDWTTPSSKKDKKKKKQEEEKKAKEEEEAKAAAANNKLSWADEMDNDDDAWAGFATVGKKKKKGKVWSAHHAFVLLLTRARPSLNLQMLRTPSTR